MKARGFLPEAHMYWIGVGALVGFAILFNLGTMLAFTFLNRKYIYEYLRCLCPEIRMVI